MRKSIIEFPSRISARAVASGLLVSFSFMILFGALAGGFDLWRFDLSVLPLLTGGFWLFSVVAWGISSYCGAYAAAIIGRATNARDGALHGVVTWSGASVLAYAWSVVAVGNIWADNVIVINPAYLFAIFWGDIFALVASFVGGWRGASSELKKERQEIDVEQRRAA